MDLSINYLAVLVAAIAAFVLGAMWHGPLFGKIWIKLAKVSDKEMKEAQAQGMAKLMVIAFLQQLVMAFVIANFAAMWNATGLMGALNLAFWPWLGFVVTSHLNAVLWERKSLHLYLFNMVYIFVSMLLVSVILVFWK